MSRTRWPRRCKSRHRRESASLPENGIHWRDAMDDAQEQLDQAEIESFLTTLAFVREYGINVISATPGRVAIELPFDERFSGPPGQFPASMVGTAGDVAAGAACPSLLARGWGRGTTDFPTKMTGIAKGKKIKNLGGGWQRRRT